MTSEAKIIESLPQVQPKPIEHAKHLNRVVNKLGVKEVAKKLGVTERWINNRLNLLLLGPGFQELVDEGRVKLSNAYAWSHVKRENQHLFVLDAINLSPLEFLRQVKLYIANGGND